jgi:hypothetical protein
MPWFLAFSDGVIITGVTPQSAMDTKLSVKFWSLQHEQNFTDKAKFSFL